MDYYNPRSNYGLGRDWRRNGLPSKHEYRRDLVQSGVTGRDLRRQMRDFWGPGGAPAYSTPFGRAMADQDPEATYRRYVGQKLGNAPATSSFGNFARNEYGDVYMAYRAALQRNPLLRFNDFLKRNNSLSPQQMDTRYRSLTPNQRGENQALYQSSQRWV